MTKNLHMSQLWIGTLFISVFGATLYVVFIMQPILDEVLENISLVLVGVLATNTTQIINYFFGSSSGSKEKTEKLGGK